MIDPLTGTTEGRDADKARGGVGSGDAVVVETPRHPADSRAMATGVEVARRSRARADARELASDYRARGVERQSAYSAFVIDRGLRPEMDARPFLELFDAAVPRLFTEIEVRGVPAPTHHLLEAVPGAVPKRIQILDRNQDAVRWVAEDRSTGSTPVGLIAELLPLDEANAIDSRGGLDTAAADGRVPATAELGSPKPDGEPTGEGVARPGDVFDVSLPGDRADRYSIHAVKDGMVHVGIVGWTSSGVKVPVDVFGQYRDDLEVRVRVSPTSGDPAVDALARGEGVYLGKGDDGIVFRVGDEAVKVSTVVPYVPFNYRPDITVESSVARLEEQTRLSEQMRVEGVPGILESRFVRHEQKGFAVRPYVEMVGELGLEDLDRIQRQMLAMHARGYALRDQVQVGTRDGEFYFFDTGKAASISGRSEPSRRDSLDCDLDNLRRLYRDNGCEYVALGGQGLADDWERLVRPFPRRGPEPDPVLRLATRERAHRIYEALRAELLESGRSAEELSEAVRVLEEQYTGIQERLRDPEVAPDVASFVGPRPPHEMSCLEYVTARLAADPQKLRPRATKRREARLSCEWAASILAAARRDPESVSTANVATYETGRIRGSFPDEPLPEKTMERLSPDERAFLDNFFERNRSVQAPPTYTVDMHKAVTARLRLGQMSADELDSHFEMLVASETAVTGELAARSIEELAPNGAAGRSKQEIVEDIYKRMLCRFSLGNVKPGHPVPEVVERVRGFVAIIEDADVRAHAARMLEDKRTGSGLAVSPQASPEIAPEVASDPREFVVLPADVRLSRSEFDRLSQQARSFGGIYRKATDGERGFLLPDHAAAEGFIEAAGLRQAATSDRASDREADPVPAAPTPSGPGLTGSHFFANLEDKLDASDRALLDRLEADAAARQTSSGPVAFAEAVLYPHPRIAPSEITALAALAGTDSVAMRLAASVTAAVERASTSQTGTISRAAVGDIRELVEVVRGRGATGPEVAAIEAALEPSRRLEALGISEARLAGVVALRAEARRLGAPVVEPSVETEVPLGFLTCAAVEGSAAEVREGDLRVVCRGGEPTIVSGLRQVEEALAEGLSTVVARIDDGALPALRRFEETLAEGRDSSQLRPGAVQGMAI